MIICTSSQRATAYLCSTYYLLDKRPLRPVMFTALDNTTMRRIKSA
jgi:hypothetical protein